MKITKEDLQEITQLLAQAESFRPVVKAILDTIKSYGSELEEIPKRLSTWAVQQRIESIKQYRKAGFANDDAIMMTLDDTSRLAKIIKSSGIKRKE